MVRFLLRGFRRPRVAVQPVLGTLERQVLEKLWKLGREASVRELHDGFAGAPAYTTLMTTADRLFKKGLLERRRVARAFLYTPRLTQDELRKEVAADVIESLLGHGRSAARPILSTFIDAVEARDVALLDEIEALILKRRRQGRNRAR